GTPSSRRLLHQVRRECSCHPQERRGAARNPHLRARGTRTPRQEVHEDRLPGTGGVVSMANKLKIKKGDLVQVIAGARESRGGDRGKIGRAACRDGREGG